MSHVRLIAFSGSTRKDSFNRKLIAAAATEAEHQGASVTVVDLNDYPMPIYNGDLEEAEGLSENVMNLQALFKSRDGFLISTPEYNGFFPALVKNTLDWLSRTSDTQASLASFKGKPVGLLSASPGGLGGIRALAQLKTQMGELGCITHGANTSVGGAFSAFNEDGSLADEARHAMMQNTVKTTIGLAASLIQEET